MEDELEKQTALALGPAWEIQTDGKEFGKDEIVRLLALRIQEWLEKDFERLVNSMYRLDIPEKQFHEAMGLQDPKKIAPKIAELVWKRELKRAWYRQKYS